MLLLLGGFVRPVYSSGGHYLQVKPCFVRPVYSSGGHYLQVKPCFLKVAQTKNLWELLKQNLLQAGCPSSPDQQCQSTEGITDNRLQSISRLEIITQQYRPTATQLSNCRSPLAINSDHSTHLQTYLQTLNYHHHTRMHINKSF